MRIENRSMLLHLNSRFDSFDLTEKIHIGLQGVKASGEGVRINKIFEKTEVISNDAQSEDHSSP